MKTSASKKAKDNSLVLSIKRQEVVVFSGKVWVVCNFLLKKLPDPLDNMPSMLKEPMDALQKAGVIGDDSGKVIQPPAINFWEKSTDGDNEVQILIVDKKPPATETFREVAMWAMKNSKQQECR